MFPLLLFLLVELLKLCLEQGAQLLHLLLVLLLQGCDGRGGRQG